MGHSIQNIEKSHNVAPVFTLRSRRRQVGTRSAGIADDVLHCQAMPNNQHDNCAYRRAYKSRALIRSVPADALTDPRRDKRTDDPERGREDETLGVIRPRQQKSRDDPRDKANQNDPDEG
jgi:hypothetical protein